MYWTCAHWLSITICGKKYKWVCMADDLITKAAFNWKIRTIFFVLSGFHIFVNFVCEYSRFESYKKIDWFCGLSDSELILVSTKYTDILIGIFIFRFELATKFNCENWNKKNSTSKVSCPELNPIYMFHIKKIHSKELLLMNMHVFFLS